MYCLPPKVDTEPEAKTSTRPSAWYDAGVRPPAEYPAGPLSGTKDQRGVGSCKEMTPASWTQSSATANTGAEEISEPNRPFGFGTSKHSQRRPFAALLNQSEKEIVAADFD